MGLGSADAPVLGPDFALAIEPSLPRRVMGAGALLGLGAGLGAVALLRPPEALGWAAFLLAAATGAVWLGLRLWRLSGRGLVLTTAGLREAGPDGRWLAPIEAVAGIEHGALAVKPSGGFVLRLHERAPGVWMPGVWWRIGRRVGVGGVLRAGQARAAADLIAVILRGRTPSTSASR